MKAFLIDVAAREIRAVDYTGLADLQRMVSGLIQFASTLPTGDIVFVDEEGLYKPGQEFFRLTQGATDQPLAGNGVVVGPEGEDGEVIRETVITLEQLSEIVEFRSREQVRAWAKAHASEPAITLSTDEGTEVFSRMGRLYGDAVED